ncbi:hypothetical protein ASG98_18840 [Bacillus sp. Soil531]|nr:hypothetical protein ASG98_18840 [Bacillus sp. Soil531]
MDFYSINNDCSKNMKVHRPLTFIFSRSHELEKDFVKKGMENYRKSDAESQIAMKKDVIQSSDESIQLYEDEKKVYKKSSKNRMKSNKI